MGARKITPCNKV